MKTILSKLRGLIPVFRLRVALLIGILFLGIQWIPFSLTNPPEKLNLIWNTPQTETLFRRACADCHSHQTQWPWYSHIAPLSWYTRDHVVDAREAMNISIPQHAEPDEIAHQIKTGKMPLFSYLLLHPQARLTESEKKALIEGMEQTLKEP